jgi:hypothetical protein
VSGGELALDADLVAGVLGDPRGAPSLHSCNVELRQRHRVIRREVFGLRC